MPLIKTIEEDQATGEIAKMYQNIKAVRGSVSKAHKLFSSSEPLLKMQLDFISFYVNHKTLSQELLATIRMLISERNDCKFCIGFNEAMLRNKFGWSEDDILTAKNEPSKAKLSDRERMMLLFVLKAVANAHSIEKSDVDALLAEGFQDSDILEAVNHGAKMSALDIIFDTFKIED